MINPTAAVVFRRDGRAGRVTLNRPRALNALTMEMVQDIALALETWRDDPAIHLVLIEASGERAFCAGGDVRSVREWVLDEQFQQVENFFVLEYALNRVIARYTKPYVAVIDGICMGGGIGLSIHGSVRVATEHAAFAMPETQLGLFPDVGGSYFLPRLRGRFGMYLGLTGARIGVADAAWLGLVTHFVPRAAIQVLIKGLLEDGIGALVQYTEPPPAPALSTIEREVNDIFGEDSVAAIMRRLETISADWATNALSAMRSASPSALHWTFDLLRSGADRTLEECQRAEVLLTRRACRHPDFAEGVRAAVVDKDRHPKWLPLDAP